MHSKGSGKLLGMAAAMLLVLVGGACGTRLSNQAILSANEGNGAASVGGSSPGSVGTQSADTPGGTGPGGGQTPSGSNGTATGAGSMGGSAGPGRSGSGSTGSGSTGSGSSGSGSAGSASAGNGSASTGPAASGPESGAAVAASGLPGPAPTAGSTIVIGSVGAFSGLVGASIGNFPPMENVWAKWVNTHGGLHGHPVQVIGMDDQENPSTANTDVQTLVQSDHAIALMATSGLTVAGEPEVDALHVPVFGGSEINQNWYNGKDPNLYPVGPPLIESMITTVKLAIQAGDPKIAVFYCSEDAALCGPFDTFLVKEGGAAKYGGQVVYSDAASLTSPSFTAQCISAKNAGAQAVFLAMDSGSLQRFSQNCASQGYHPHFESYSVAVNESLDSTSSLYGLQAAIPTQAWKADNTPAMAAFHQAVAQYDPSLVIGTGDVLVWASGMLLIQAADAGLGAGTPTGTELVNGAETLSNDDLWGATIAMSWHKGAPASYAPCDYVQTLGAQGWSVTGGLTCNGSGMQSGWPS